ncbi:MAG TPA: DUF255 domain-containing protein [Candidatus Obscuribacterales bacterium]
MLRACVILIVFALLMPTAFAVETKSDSSNTPKIQWQAWSDQVFEKARAENKIVVLDLQAVWCHWCHVMEERTYSNPAVERLMNSSVIAVKVDQDSRPDLSNQYSDYGWPATIIFNSDGTELAKRAGFIEPDEMVGLLQDLIKTRKPEEAAKKPAIQFSAAGSLSALLRKQLVANHINGYDTVNGAWSNGQKFLEPDSVEYALTRAKEGSAKERQMAKQTLDVQLNLLDPVWGGMYQYSTHDDWKHPHFEKIMNVQADNMRVYSLGYLLFGDSKYLATAKSIDSFLNKFMLSPEGAFYTSMDADVIQGKHSDAYFKLNDLGRRKQGIPRIDTHIYARENGWAINGLIALYEASGDKQYLDSAVRAANWIIAHRAIEGGGYRHDEKDVAGPYLGDTLYFGQALLSLYAATADRQWLKRAEDAGNFIESTFKQADSAPGFVTARSTGSAVAQPEPLLDENVAAVRFLNMLSRYDANAKYKTMAETAMRYVATPAIAAKHKIFVAGILLADKELNSDPIHITVVGRKEDPAALVLFKQAQKYPVSYKELEWYDKKEGPLPSGAAEFPDLDRAAAFGCAFKRCSLPIFAPEGIAKTVDAFAKMQ